MVNRKFLSFFKQNKHFRVLIQDRPLNIRAGSVRNVTNNSLTIEWEDDNYNRNANITFYELVLK